MIVEVRGDLDMSPDDIASEVNVWNALPALPAVRDGQVHFLLGGELVIPGPRVAEATVRLARTLHPDVFADP